MSIELRNIDKRFGDFVAVDNVSLTVETGELLALLGPSGSGKTTLLRIIAGLEWPDAGAVSFHGEDATSMHARDRQVGFVFQHYALFGHLTIFENIAFGLRVRPRKHRPSEAAIAKKVHTLLDLVQLDWLADRFPHQLSGGQRQRIALARALAVEPRVLLLDEPLTALDARLRDALRSEMNTLLRDLGITTVYVTHDQAEAMELGDRIVVMSAGRIEQIGTPRDIYYRPANRAVAQFVGTINRVAGERRGGMLTTIGGAVPLPSAHRDLSAQSDSTHEIFFRPEDAFLADPDHAQLRGLIESSAFLGERTRLTISGAAPDALFVDVAGRVELARGTPVGISIGHDALIALS